MDSEVEREQTASNEGEANLLTTPEKHHHTHDHDHDHHNHDHHDHDHDHDHSSNVRRSQLKASVKASQCSHHGLAHSHGHGGADHGHGQGHGDENMNVRAAIIHIIGDCIQSIGVVIAAIIIYFRPDWHIADPICTFIFTLICLITTIPIFRDCMYILMESTPAGLDIAEVFSDLIKVRCFCIVFN